MLNVKQRLLDLGIVYDNDFLTSYERLIVDNKETKQQKYYTQRHHIIPRNYFEKMDLKVDNTKGNIINLYFKDHILAHYYLAKCSKEDWFKINNTLAVQYMLNNKRFGGLTDIKEINLNELEELYAETRKLVACPMFNKEIYEKHSRIVKSQFNRNRISNTMKDKAARGELFSKEHKQNLSKMASNQVWINKDNVYTHILKDKLEEYLNNGWVLGAKPLSEEHKQALINSHLGVKYSDELKEKLRIAHLGQVPWNKGKPYDDTTKEKIRQAILGRIWVNNDIEEHQITQDELNIYLEKGFKKGRLFRKRRRVIK